VTPSIIITHTHNYLSLLEGEVDTTQMSEPTTPLSQGPSTSLAVSRRTTTIQKNI
jgi:hypothetical protein